jgi:hypothetical protein
MIRLLSVMIRLPDALYLRVMTDHDAMIKAQRSHGHGHSQGHGHGQGQGHCVFTLAATRNVTDESQVLNPHKSAGISPGKGTEHKVSASFSFSEDCK